MYCGSGEMTQWLRALLTLVEDWELVSRPTCGVSQPPVTPAPEDLMPSTGHPWPPAHMCAYLETHTHIHINKNKIKF